MTYLDLPPSMLMLSFMRFSYTHEKTTLKCGVLYMLVFVSVFVCVFNILPRLLVHLHIYHLHHHTSKTIRFTIDSYFSDILGRPNPFYLS